VGGEKTISVDVRIISAANRDLRREVEQGRFRDDLYYRLNVVPVYLPSLRERKNDIPLLVDSFLNKALTGGQRHDGISKEALGILMGYDWPGNIRELQSAIRYALIMARGKIILAQHLPAELTKAERYPLLRGPSRKLELKNVRDALAMSGGNKAKAARRLGVGRATLYRFLSECPDLFSSLL
jgi:transcriptional regulator with PAS, ATPase and Fis domain